MNLDSKIYIAGHRGLVGSAIWKQLKSKGYTNLIGKTSSELNLMDAVATQKFFEEEKNNSQRHYNNCRSKYMPPQCLKMPKKRHLAVLISRRRK